MSKSNKKPGKIQKGVVPPPPKSKPKKWLKNNCKRVMIRKNKVTEATFTIGVPKEEL